MVRFAVMILDDTNEIEPRTVRLGSISFYQRLERTNANYDWRDSVEMVSSPTDASLSTAQGGCNRVRPN